MFTFHAMPTDKARAFQGGAPDAYGNAPEPAVSDGAGVPCRHCLKLLPKGTPYLILAYRPFGALQPYAETGPIFLCAEPCESGTGQQLPEVFSDSPDYLIKGYTPDERIAYGTGAIVARADFASEIAARLENSALAFVDIRSARNNCWQARARRG